MHTLRSFSLLRVVDGEYTAGFIGDPQLGGNWLNGGNLDGSRVIDVLDYAIFIGQYLSHRISRTPCDVAGRNADLNGDGLVDQLDWSFIQTNYLRQDKQGCCLTTVAAAAEAEAITRVSVDQLNRMGVEGSDRADINRDGVIDEADIRAFQAGERPGRMIRHSQKKSR